MIHINNAIKRHGHLNDRNERMTAKLHAYDFVAQINICVWQKWKGCEKGMENWIAKVTKKV
jgi:hypothetical protein